MTKNKPDNITDLLKNRELIDALTQSKEAQTLIERMKKTFSDKDLEDMTKSALSGDTAAIASLARSVSESDAGSELLRRLKEQFDVR